MSRVPSIVLFFTIHLATVNAVCAQTKVEVVRVVAKPVERQVRLPGELQPYLAVAIHAKVSGFVRRMDVDRGSVVKQGQLLARLEAPEMQAQIVEAESKEQSLELQRTEAEAKLAAAQSTYEHLKAASATPGVVAENDVVVAQKAAEGAEAAVRSYQNSIKAAHAQANAVRDSVSIWRLRRHSMESSPSATPSGGACRPRSGDTPLLVSIRYHDSA